MGAIDGAYGEVCCCGGYVGAEGVAGPVVPFKGCGAGDGFPQVGCYPDADVSGRGVGVGGDDDGLEGVFGRVVQDFPPPVVLDAGPCRCYPDVFELPV